MANTGKPLIRALQGERVRPVPFWLMRQAGRYLPEYRALREKAGGFLDLCYAPELAAEVTLQPIRRYGMDGAILFADILLVPQGMGQKLWFEVGEGPRLTPVRNRQDVEALRPEDVVGKLAPIYEAASRVAKSLPEQTALIGFAGAPWTVATYMVEGSSSREYAKVKEWAFGDPAGFGLVIDRLVEATIAHLNAQIAAGVNAVQIFDTWAGIVPEDAFDRLVIAPTQRIVAGIRKVHPDIPIIGFPRGIGANYPRYFRETGINALNIDSSMDLDVVAKELQPIGVVQGNLDPNVLLAGGVAMDQAVTAILDKLGKGPFVFNLGHGVLPPTPVEHVARLAELIRAHG